MSSFPKQQFFEAAFAGDFSIVKGLAVDPTLDVNWKEPRSGWTPFHGACSRGRVEVVMFLLANPEVDVNMPNENEATPFLVACFNGHKEVVSLFLANIRIDINKRNVNEATPFYIACQKGHKEVVSLLLT